MLTTILGVVQEGKIEPLERVDVPNGTRALITLLPDDRQFWLHASQASLEAVWDNPEDDVYEHLLQK